MQFSIAKIFTLALMAASVIEAHDGSGNGSGGNGKGKRGRGRHRGKGKGKGKDCSTDILPTTFQTVTVDATSTVTTQRPSSTEPADDGNVVVVETTVVVVDQGQRAPGTTVVTPDAVEPTTTAAPVKPAPTTKPAAPPATTAAPGNSGPSSDAQQALAAHNAARAEVGVPALVWDDALAAEALQWAQHLTSVGSLQHSDGSERSGAGENLFWQSNSADTPLLIGSNAWISEKSVYHGEAIGEGDFSGYGHYTQVVWKSTTAVGVAAASDSNGGVYVVARYAPAGNVVGQKPF